MTKTQFNAAYRGFCRRRPFHSFRIEFDNGRELLISHPEAVRNEADLYVMRCPDGSNVIFGAESVSRFHDLPETPKA